MASGLRNGDSAAFERYTPNDYTATVASGQLVTKQQTLQFHKNNKYESFDLDDLAVRSYGDVAVVTGRVHQKGTTGQKEGLDIQARFTSVWAKMNGRWMKVAMHLSDVPPKIQ